VVTFLRACVEWAAVFFEAELVDLWALVEEEAFFLGVEVLSCASGPLLGHISRQTRQTIKRVKEFTAFSVARLFPIDDDKSLTESIPVSDIRDAASSVYRHRLHQGR
jgi:hypothetical protein